MKAKQKQNLDMTLQWQSIASLRQVKLQDRYEALAKDVLLITQGQEPKHSMELV